MEETKMEETISVNFFLSKLLCNKIVVSIAKEKKRKK